MSRLILLFLLLTPVVLRAQDAKVLEGYVFELPSEASLPGANIYWKSNPQSGVVSDINGKFSIPVISLPATLIVSFVGFEPASRQITAKDVENSVRFFLRAEELSLEEIIVRERAPDQNIRGLEMGKSSVPIETIKNIPALFGEVDLLRSLQLLPGVQTAGEGTTGLFVRGGSADQNLVQLDGAPIYNPSHFFGFFSVFNPDALSGVDFYKGNIPANLGGRISSVIDIGLKEGNYQKIKGEGGIGTISSRLTVDGPLFSDKSSFVVSGRRTYADLFLRLSNDENIRNNSLYFYDLSGKFTFKLSNKDKLSVSSYFGRDFLGISEQFGFGWDNWITSITWNRAIRDDFFLDVNGYHSYYKYLVTFEDPDSGFLWDNILEETGLKATWTWLPDQESSLVWGFHSQLYRFAPISLRPEPGSVIEPIATNPRNGLQNNFFVSYARELTDRISLEAGIRANTYNQVGRGVKYIYENDIPAPESQLLDTLSFGSFENMKFFSGLEPRVAFRYLIDPMTSLKASYNRTNQYIQVASNSSAGLPLDRWIPAGFYIPPIIGDQFSLGIFKNLQNNTWELSLEGFYKNFQNIIDLRQGASIIFTDNVETEILAGRGYAYGAEFLLRKNVGKTTGWLSYTYSRTWRVIDGISENLPFNPRFDRPHDIALVANHQFDKRWSAALTFIYTTGQAVTFPIGTYMMDNQRLPLYGPLRNEDRFPDYHRMDASVTWKNRDQGKKWRGSWNFSIYNLYGRKNPFSYQFTEILNEDIRFDPSSGPVTSRRPGVVMTYLFTFLPALTYNFEF